MASADDLHAGSDNLNIARYYLNKNYLDASLHTQALVASVQNSDNAKHDVTQGIHSHGDSPRGSKRHAWLEKLIPGIENVTVKYHGGNYVAVRDPSKPPGSVKVFESMPIYAR